MERTRIRSVVASLWEAADTHGDQELAMLLAQVHAALLNDQVQLLYEYMRDIDGTERHTANGIAGLHDRYGPERLLKRERG